MKPSLAITALVSLVSGGSASAQTPAPSPPSAPPPEAAASNETLQDLNALTFTCPKAALNAAAREAAKVPAEGTYQFAYFNIITGSHHARYEVDFKSNYAGEPDLKYCVMLYCQQGWDPASAQLTITRLNAAPSPHAEKCAEPVHARAKHDKHAAGPRPASSK